MVQPPTLPRIFVATAGNAFVTSARLELLGGHEHISIWIHHQSIGTVVCAEGDGAKLMQLLQLAEDSQPKEA